RYRTVTGVQTCALPIWWSQALVMASDRGSHRRWIAGRVVSDQVELLGVATGSVARACRGPDPGEVAGTSSVTVQEIQEVLDVGEIGRASCREGGEIAVA